MRPGRRKSRGDMDLLAWKPPQPASRMGIAIKTQISFLIGPKEKPKPESLLVLAFARLNCF